MRQGLAKRLDATEATSGNAWRDSLTHNKIANPSTGLKINSHQRPWRYSIYVSWVN